MYTSVRIHKFLFAALAAAVTIAVMFFSSDALAASNIGTSRAKEIASAHAGFSTKQVSFKKAKLEKDDGIAEYEIDFTKSGTRYEYDIDAQSGDIREYTHKKTSVARGSRSNKDYIAVEEAKRIALAHAGLTESQVTFTTQKLDYDRVWEYELEFYTSDQSYEYDIDAHKGTINEYTHKLFQKRASAQSGQKPQAAPKPAAPQSNADLIGIDRAKEIAAAHKGFRVEQVRFTKAKADREDGRAVYEIEYRSGRWEYEFEIDAHTGKILDFDIDD